MRPVRLQGGGEDRGEAGETTGASESGKYNFANLYALNRSDRLVDQKADEFEGRALEIDRAMKRAGDKTFQGVKAEDNSDLGWAKKASGDLTNATKSFSVANEAMKQGLSPYQSGITGWYGGSGTPALDKIHSYGNMYNQVLRNAAGLEAFKMPKPIGKPEYPQEPDHPTRLPNAHDDPHLAEQQSSANQAGRGDRTTVLGNLDWGLKTGKITSEEYYYAMNHLNSPDEKTKAILGRLG